MGRDRREGTVHVWVLGRKVNLIKMVDRTRNFHPNPDELEIRVRGRLTPNTLHSSVEGHTKKKKKGD